jgi:Cupin domain
MRVAKNEIPVKFDVPGAVTRQAEGFGDASGFGALGGEYFSLGSGTDIAPLLKGLEGDACQVPHWGYVLAGELVVTYLDGNEETCSADDLFYWPPGHSVRVVDDAEVILFSPRLEHGQVLDHMLAQMHGG